MPEPSTVLLHGDDHLRTGQGVTADISTSTTYRYAAPEDALHVQSAPPAFDPLGQRFIYSRITNPNMSKAETLVGQLCNGQALAVSSGLGAGYLALVFLNPPAVAIRDGYHGCHKTIEVFQRIRSDMVSDESRDCGVIELLTDFVAGTTRSASLILTLNILKAQCAGWRRLSTPLVNRETSSSVSEG